MTLETGKPKTREQIAGLERAVEEQASQLAEHRRIVAALVEQIDRLDRRLTETTERVTSESDAVRTTAASVGERLDASLQRVGKSVKDVRRQSKALMQDFAKLQTRLARLASPLNPSVDERFLEIAQPLVEARHTLLGYDRLFTLWQAARNVAQLNCPAVEVGTFRGGSAALLAHALQAFVGAPRDLHVVDTFEGHLDATFSAHDPEKQRGKFRTVTVEAVRAFLSQFPGVQVHHGDAAVVVADWPEREYSLVHLDVDLYHPTLQGLQYFGARLARGGIIVVDDYLAPTCPGVAIAVQEYLTSAAAFELWTLQAEQAVLIRRS